MDHSERDQLIKMYLQAINDNANDWNDGNLKDFVETFHEKDLIWIPPTYHPESELKGHEKLKEYWTRTVKSFPDIKITLIDEIHNKESSWLYTEVHATHLGDFLSIKATGNRVNYEQVIMISQGPNFKIQYLKTLNDSLKIFQQLGKAIIEEDNELQIAQYLNSLRSIGLLPS